jgi:GntR family transcriptional regulator/MocR family aminotransferase
VVEGTQTAQRLIIDVLLREGDAVVIEDPGYNMLRASLIARRIRLEPVAVDFEGVQIADAPAALAAFVTPSHQYPLATIMSMARRRELLDWAHANDAYIVEDDYDGEFSFASKPLPTLQSLDRSRVIYVGSFSKSLAPGLRLGYLVVPPRLVEAFELARLLATFGGTRFVQATLAEFLVEGHFARHVRRLTRSHDERRRALLETLARHLPPDRFRVQGGKAGLHLAVIAPADFDDVAMSERLREHGIFTEPLSYCCVARTDCRGFIVGYSAAPPNEIAEAARRFCAIVGS